MAALTLQLPFHNSSEISPEFPSRHQNPGDNSGDEDPLLYLCWRQQSCSSCLAASKVCILNLHPQPPPPPFQLLASLTDPHICPLGTRERWELRAAPLGCNVSTITFLSSFVSVLGTLALLLVGWAAVVAGRAGWRGLRRAWMRGGSGSGIGIGIGGDGGDGGWRWVNRRGRDRRVLVFVEEGRGGGGGCGNNGERRPLLG
ncbi:hypothetical protein AJ79_09747 [Helicocarpus griseus UAMH5409]|uniref:Uncharacterized protein n=1 Tax=Helicocarpus griseus UAMH5409 TaxID=1447875 RepID=A0A2B7WHK9_9EURO|nr:hypothetical protein AJ79_09747 [Helicocarpus griseus UAMH5409]